jgi:hypothetical protein
VEKDSLSLKLLSPFKMKGSETKIKERRKNRKKQKVDLMSQNYLKRKGFRIKGSKFSIKRVRNCLEVFVDFVQMILAEVINVKHVAKACKRKGNLRSHCLCLNEINLLT